MSRPYRLDPEHGIHHVYNRATRRWTLFIDRLDYERFLRRLGVVCQRYGVRVYAYCLMGNHFHLIVYCPNQQLSAALRDLKSVYARYHNDRHGFSGPLFESRFHSKLVRSYQYLQTLGRYAHRNPLAIDPAISLVDYPWSSLSYFADAALPSPEWLDPQCLLAFSKNRADYLRFVERNQRGDELQTVPQTSERSGSISRKEQHLSISSIVLAVAVAARCDVAAIQKRRSNGLAGLAALIATELGSYTAAEVADALGFTSSNGVYNAKQRARTRTRSDAEFRDVLDSAVRKLGLTNTPSA